MRTAIKINKVVKVIDNEITVLDEAFDYGDGFKGLTGSTFEPITKAFYKQQTTLSAIEDHLRECVNEEEVPDEYLYTDSETKLSKHPYKRWAKAIKEADEAGQVMFDTSYSNLWDDLREQLGLTETEAYIFNCIGGGRCFKADDKFTHNVELEKYLDYEK